MRDITTILGAANGLGLVLSPWGNLPNGGSPWEVEMLYPVPEPLKPYDAMYNTRGEAGFYHDSPMGGAGLGYIPTNIQVSSQACYVPFQNAPITTAEVFWPTSWVPPNGWSPAGGYGPQPTWRKRGLGETAAEAAVEDAARHQRKVFILQVLTTTAVVAVSALNFYRGIKEEAVKRRVASASGTAGIGRARSRRRR